MKKEELLKEIELEIARLKIKEANGGETYGLLDDADEVKRVLEGESFIMTAKREGYADMIRIVAGERPSFIGADGVVRYSNPDFRSWYKVKLLMSEQQFFSYPTENEILNAMSDWYGKMLKKHNKMDALLASGKAKVSTSLIEIDFEIVEKNFGEPLR